MTAPTRKRKTPTHRHQAHKMEILGSMTGGVAHDFNNILSGIRAAVQSAMLSLKDHEHLLADMEAIHQETQRASEMIQHLLRFTRATPRRTNRIPLEDSIRQMLPMLRWALPRGIKAEPVFAPTPLAVRMHRTEIEQILLNLVINARDAMPCGGCIEIQTSPLTLSDSENPFQDILQPGLYAAITVSDSGTGIAPDILPHVFTPLFTTKRGDKGSGLGLSVVHSIVTKRGGHIYIENRTSGGTRVVILLPAHTTPSATPSAARRRLVTRGGETILFADDNKTFNKAFSHILQNAGFHVLSAIDGQQAIALYTAHQEKIGAVMLDTEMPLVSGIHCLAEILAINTDASIIMMSGNDEKAVIAQCIDAGAKAFLAKPFDAATGLHLLRKVLDKA